MPEHVDVAIEKEIDARGSFSPGPLMELICEVRGMPVGSVLAVLSSDPGSARVIPPWIRKAKHEFLGALREQGSTRFVMRKTHEKRIWWRNTHPEHMQGDCCRPVERPTCTTISKEEKYP
jgi:tRNA 2-thiouridine synthesizing protein A